jgi:hypothetical protein
MQFSPFTRHLIPLRSKHPTRCYTLKMAYYVLGVETSSGSNFILQRILYATFVHKVSRLSLLFPGIAQHLSKSRY